MGINDSDEEAYELCRRLQDIHAKVNRCPSIPWPGTKYECSSGNRIHGFGETLNEHDSAEKHNAIMQERAAWKSFVATSKPIAETNSFVSQVDASRTNVAVDATALKK